MAASRTEQMLYNRITKEFTITGDLYIINYFTETPYPTEDQLRAIKKETECPVRILKRKFCAMRQKSPLSTYLHLRMSNAIDLFNTITMDESMALKAQILAADKYEHLINPVHVDKKINITEISSFTSSRTTDGKYLQDFMTCLMKPNNLNHRHNKESFISITPACTMWSSVEEMAKKFCTSQLIDILTIPCHCIMLRTRWLTLQLALSESDIHVSRLCSTKGCIEDTHIVLESTSIITDRQRCGGIIVVLRPWGATPSKRIVTIQPCIHGTAHPNADGDYLRYSCRKMHVSVLDEISCAFLDNVCKTNAC